MEKKFSLEVLMEKYKELSHFEKIEVDQIKGAFDMKLEYEEALKVTTPSVREIVESYINMEPLERMDFNYSIDSIQF